MRQAVQNLARSSGGSPEFGGNIAENRKPIESSDKQASRLLYGEELAVECLALWHEHVGNFEYSQSRSLLVESFRRTWHGARCGSRR